MDRATLAAEIDALVNEQRSTALWFAPLDFLPKTDDERLWALTEIQKRADRATFARAARLKRWLSPTSSDASAGSSPTSASKAANNTSPAASR